MADYETGVGSDDDSFVMVGVKDFYQSFSDEGSASESTDQGIVSEPYSDVDSDHSSYLSSDACDDYLFDLRLEDNYDMDGGFQFKTVAYQKLGDVFEFPAHIKRKEDMKIKDVVMEHALPFIPAKSLLRFRAVSKEWDKWITNPFLAHKQSYSYKNISGFFYQHAFCDPLFKALDEFACVGVPGPSLRFLPEPVDIRSSCNGLLLCQGRIGDDPYYVCNPVTKEWQMIPKSPYYHGNDTAKVLAFEPSVLNIRADYHIVCAVPSLGQPIICFDIYSSATRSWRRSGTDRIVLESSALKNNGFYLNGFVYWQIKSAKALAFDIKDEFCEILPLPFERPSVGVLTHMHGELCYIHAYKQLPTVFSVDIYGGMEMTLKQSFESDFGFTLGMDYRVLPCVNDLVMILLNDTLYSYNVRDQKVQLIGTVVGYDDQYPSLNWRFLPYVNSLVSVIKN